MKKNDVLGCCTEPVEVLFSEEISIINLYLKNYFSKAVPMTTIVAPDL